MCLVLVCGSRSDFTSFTISRNRAQRRPPKEDIEKPYPPVVKRNEMLYAGVVIGLDLWNGLVIDKSCWISLNTSLSSPSHQHTRALKDPTVFLNIKGPNNNNRLYSTLSRNRNWLLERPSQFLFSLLSVRQVGGSVPLR